MKRILLVDDEVEFAKALQVRLKEADYEVLVAYDGEEALEKTRKEIPDLIILDLMLPKIDGYKVCQILKSDEKYKKIPVIMLTARSHWSDEEHGCETGADAYITKPFEPSVLLSKIKELLADK